MDECCQAKSHALEQLHRSQTRILWIVLAINVTMFVVEAVAGWLGRSLALSGDALDMLGDAIAYGSSIYVINKGRRAKAMSASLKGSIMVLAALGVLAQAVYRLVTRTTPEAAVMGGVTALALAANVTCLVLLTRFKNNDVNMSSVWLCSRNDLIANVSVLAAAGMVWWTGSYWPDTIVGLGITALFLRSGLMVLAQARAELRPT